MRTESTRISLMTLLITYIVVKVVHLLTGFNYNPFEEGLLTIKFVLDVVSWVMVYGLVYFIVKKVREPKLG
ncbi:hypothetical protein [Rufibacter tibetensis]|uniref:Uncharacterized protein n=1 Tax=Rufibacter tibetensis TaxID=512763 RepID=A0A0P0CZL1_9BACT|nr:hypothetical protein [Rufibacter tibetensis]ALI99977.1 hypothetical protein DC20_14595 [Rufibacter tibetensis]